MIIQQERARAQYGTEKMFKPPNWVIHLGRSRVDFSKLNLDSGDEADEGIEVERKLVWLRELSKDGEGDVENVD